MRKTFLLLIVLLGLVALTVTACGSDEDSSPAAATATDEGEEEGEDEITDEEAAAEIDEIKRMLDEGLAQYQDGDQEAADTTVGDAYLEHFEKVEHPLEEQDHELMEDLEHRISTEIRDEMKEGASADEVAALVEQTKADLDTAKAKLQEAQ
jgi:molybdenum-dependent DNA-binding transcriptional regulator ModE